jgi:hypothetical protein
LSKLEKEKIWRLRRMNENLRSQNTTAQQEDCSYSEGENLKRQLNK